MAGLVVQSRFAGLKIEDDDYPSSSDVEKVKSKPKPSSANAKKPDPPKKAKPTNSKTTTNNKKKKSKPGQQPSAQWEQWKQKDEELVDGNFETELQQAILLSKLDYEEKKDVYKQLKKEAELEKKFKHDEAKAGKKQKKKNVMSLDQFNDMMNTGEEPRHSHEEEHRSAEAKSPDKDTEFFERVKDDTKNELLREKNIERVRHRQSLPDEVITRVQFADALEKKEQEIAALRDEVSELKQELLTVKSRNRKLCNILGQGEMRDKAAVLVEVERLRAGQAELTAELAALHTDLERERSRNQDARTTNKKKKGANTEKEK